MDTNAGRSIVINEYSKWYYFDHAFNECDIECDHIHEAVENLEKLIKTMYTMGDAIALGNFDHMSEYDVFSASSLLYGIINKNEIRQGIKKGDLSRLYFICDTDAIKRGVKINE